MLNQYHPRAPLKSIFVQNDPKPYCHFVILSRLFVFPLIGLAEKRGMIQQLTPTPLTRQQL